MSVARTEAQLPGGTLPDGRRPRLRGLDAHPDHLAALQEIDDQQGAGRGELVALVGDVDLDVVVVLAEAGLISIHANARGHLLVGVTPGGDRALRRYGRRDATPLVERKGATTS